MRRSSRILRSVVVLAKGDLTNASAAPEVLSSSQVWNNKSGFDLATVRNVGQRRLSKAEKAKQDESFDVQSQVEAAEEDFQLNELAPMQGMN